MNGKLYVVHILAQTYVETTVAVIAESQEEAKHMALRDVSVDTDGWVHDDPVHQDMEILGVTEETWAQVHEARQKHLLGPHLQIGDRTHLGVLPVDFKSVPGFCV